MTYDSCPCGVRLTSLRTWNAQPKWKREELKAKGTRPHYGHGMCRSCYDRHRYEPRLPVVQQHCEKCEIPVIPNSHWDKATEAERARSRRHFGRGLCSVCYNRAKRSGAIVTGANVAEEVERLQVVGLSTAQIASELDLDESKVRRLAA